MKLHGMLIAAMLAGALGATGCKSEENKVKDTAPAPAEAAADTKTATPEDNPDTAEASETNVSAENPGTEKDARWYRYWAPRAPPALRVEERGAVPHAGW